MQQTTLKDSISSEACLQKSSSSDENKQQLFSIKAAVADDLSAVDRLISQQLQDRLHLIKTVCEYIIQSGGKRIRPLLVILAANALGYQGKDHITLAAIAEFLHTATLLHDDVIDCSTLRRHQETANHIWNNETSILVGDFLHALSFQMIVDLGNIKAMEVLANATTGIVTGEVMQLVHRQSTDVSEERYMEVIYRKTARLFEVAAQLGGVVSYCSESDLEYLTQYGAHLGIAYQLVDDVLDYTASPKVWGKRIGDDFAEGKITLPLIYALRYSSVKESQLIKTALETSDQHSLDDIVKIMRSTQAIQRTQRLIQTHIDKAMQCLDQLTKAGANCDLLQQLTTFIAGRVY